ncbi:MAG TPA: PQQ-binding-like beta-propeller repeat protein [Planctomycetaceae bacterium]|nr:PQQ-binding-like beta-propeller repeat protein [Planctomycetaceae bacterium]
MASGVILPAAILLGLLAGQDGSQRQPADSAVTLLAENGLEPTAESLDAYLWSLHPDGDARDRLAALISQLGDEDFFRREAAMRELLRRPVHAPELLDEAIEGDDAEIRWRAAQVKKVGGRRLARLLAAVFGTIEEHEIDGLAEPVLEAIPFCANEHLLAGARRALAATARSDSEDVDLLTRALARDNARIVSAAATTLERIAGEKAGAALLPILQHDDDRARLAAARALANHGARASLPVLVELLEAEDLHVRGESAQTLRMLTGEHFGFVGYEDEQRRGEAVAQWREWLAAHGETAELQFPLRDAAVVLGRTLIAYYANNRVVEYDSDGNVVWNQAVGTPRGVDGLPNGHRVVASYSTRIVIEYDAEGGEIWRSDVLPGTPYSCQRLPNGNTLVACYSTREVVEIRPDRTIAWRKQLDAAPRDARRLDNGHTLVALYTSSRVVELDAAGDVVWQAENMNRPYSVERLDNGHTLVSQNGARQVAEIDSTGEVVWKKDGLMYPYDARRLANGNTLIVDRNGVREIDRGGETVWEKAGPGAARVVRY